MKVVMTLLVRDEEDILHQNILYHLEQGVDFFIVTDNLSTDSSPDIIKKFESQGLAYLINESDDTYSQAVWVTKMAQLAKIKFEADWVINNDADEFWWPSDKNIKTALAKIPEIYQVVSARRHNFVPNLKATVFSEMIVRYLNSKNHLGQSLPNKVCHRGLKDVQVNQGNHGLSWPPNISVYPEQIFEIFHFPIRTYAQFENKIAKGGAAYERNKQLPTSEGITWRKLYAEWQQGNLPSYFERETMTDKEIECGLQTGELVCDSRLRDYIESHNITGMFR
ncbi:MAG: glycosyltransferase family 2 protein [Bacteroidetes bacterium]|nr:glycosyltransferase family 2 protein [Bacteroidota bacterium]